MYTYFVWSLLPIALLFWTIKAVWKKTFKMSGREYPKERFSQLVFCTICFVIAIALDKWFLASFLDTIRIEFFDTRIARWLIYPAILVFGGSIQKALGLDPDKNKEIDAKRKGGRPMLTHGR